MTDEDLIRGLYRILTGDIEHVYHGMCPDENDPSLRDVCCHACQLMLIAEEFNEQARLNGMGSEREAALMAKLEAAEKERDTLHAKIERMDKQGPVAWADAFGEPFRNRCEIDGVASPLYALPGAQDVPKEAIAKIMTEVMNIAVANGADSRSMPDEYVEVAAWLCGSPAQPTPSVPEGWLRAIDEALVVTHLGVANAGDTYEQAKAKLDSLIGFHVDAATDPVVNGGWQLVPVNPTETFYQCFSAYDGTSYSNPFSLDDFVKDWREALAKATEVKS